MSFAELLTQEQVERVHEGSLEILEEVGLLVRHGPARDLFREHGCDVDSETNRVKFPRAIVEKYRKVYPPKFTFRGRDPKYDKTIPDDSPVIVTGSSAPDILDPVTGVERRSVISDIVMIAHLIQELPAYDMFSVSVLADDAPSDQFTLARLYPALKYCAKPIRITSKDLPDAKDILQLAYLVAGSEEAYREHPFITHHYCPVVSPLTMDHLSTEAVMFFAEQGLPVYPTIVPNAGLTSPMSLAGTVVQGNAEFLAAATLMQMVREGTPLIYATLPTVADMRTGAYASGGIECGMLHMAHAQMAHFYNVPCGGYVGLTNSKTNDAQSGYETGLSTMAGLLAGMDMMNMGGLIEALKTFDFAKAVIDDEIAQMLKRMKRGLEFSEENLAVDVIKKIGPGGSFIVEPHTIKRMKTAGLLTKLSNRDTRTQWEKKGAPDIHARAMARVREILAKPSSTMFSPEVESRIRAHFTDLISAEMEVPEGLQVASS
jgi:trimethylamine---corrinoid protein Co-methyltransferase